MATYIFRITNTCAGGHHYTLEVSGDYQATFPIDRESIQNLDLTNEQVAMVLLKLFARDKTLSQTRSALLSGITINI